MASPDVVVGSWDGRMYAWDHAGRALPGWPVAAGDQFISSAALVDLTGDDLPDVVAGSKDGFLYAWNGRGEPLPGFPVSLGAYVFSSPWVGDLRRTQQMPVPTWSSARTTASMCCGTSPRLGRSVWPKFHRDDRNSGWAGAAP